MTRSAHRFSLALVLGLGMIAACGSADSDGDIDSQCYSDATDCVDPAGEHFTYVLSSLRLPASAQEARTLGLDLDGAPNEQIDNQLGSVIQGLGNFAEIDLQQVFDDLVADGTLVLIIDIQSTDIAGADAVGASLHVGINPSPSACADDNDEVCGRHLDGNAVVDIDTSASLDATIAARIAGGKLFGGPGAARATIDLSELLPVQPITLNSIGTLVEADISESGFEGVIAGAVSETEVRQIVLPLISELPSADCAGTPPDACCVAGSIGEAVVNIFDSNGDCAVTVDELEGNQLLDGFLQPDVDMLDADGRFAPASDGVPDSFSLGAGFEAVPVQVQGL